MLYPKNAHQFYLKASYLRPINIVSWGTGKFCLNPENKQALQKMYSIFYLFSFNLKDLLRWERGKKKSWERIWERKARNLGIWRRPRAASLKHSFLSFALSRLFPFPFLTFSLPLSHIWSVSCVAAWLLAHYGTACVGTERQTSVRFSKSQPRKVQ